MNDTRARLGALRRQSGLAAGEVDAAGERDTIDALRERLQRVGAGRRRAPRRRRIGDGTLASRLGGDLVHDGVILVRERLPVDAAHGDFPLSDPASRPGLVLGGAGVTPRDCVFMDTETTGLAGGTGTLVFLLGMARFRGGELEVVQLLLTGFEGEGAMLDAARGYLRGADALVTFNGRSFDAPLLAARYRLCGSRDPFAELPHVDLLAPTRRAFKTRWPDCRLQTAERRLLGVTRVDDLPGAEAPRAWFDWVRHGREGALTGVCSHNRLDLLSLVVLPAALQGSHEDPEATGADAHAWAKHRHRVLGEQAAFDYLQRHRGTLETDGLLELARLARRRRDWSLAVAIWEQLAGKGEPAAIEHLAKYLEHEKKDFRQALEATARRLARAPDDRHHLRRDARLRGRLA
jgi:uncharacterized protein YprB with RNaseH-like and TPR domain